MWRVLAMLIGLSACTPASTSDAGVDGGFVPTHARVLGLNDVTFLLPLESLDAGSPFPNPFEVIPFASFDRLSNGAPVVRTELARLRVLAVRFDLCDRAAPLPCAEDAEGVFRLVLQPVYGVPARVEDVAFHAFFPVPRAEVPEVVDQLRALAQLQDVPRNAALQVNTAFGSNDAYREQLGALVSRYAKATALYRLTLFGQETERAAIVWIFRGEERSGSGGLGPIELPSGLGTSQEVLLFGGDSYQVTPLADVPPGFARAELQVSHPAGARLLRRHPADLTAGDQRDRERARRNRAAFSAAPLNRSASWYRHNGAMLAPVSRLPRGPHDSKFVVKPALRRAPLCLRRHGHALRRRPSFV